MAQATQQNAPALLQRVAQMIRLGWQRPGVLRILCAGIAVALLLAAIAATVIEAGNGERAGRISRPGLVAAVA
jgi:hypothetical protein